MATGRQVRPRQAAVAARRRKRRTERQPKVNDIVEIWWDVDKTYYRGRLSRRLSEQMRFTILYDDGEKEDVNLHNEFWKFVDNQDISPTSSQSHSDPDSHEVNPQHNLLHHRHDKPLATPLDKATEAVHLTSSEERKPQKRSLDNLELVRPSQISSDSKAKKISTDSERNIQKKKRTRKPNSEKHTTGKLMQKLQCPSHPTSQPMNHKIEDRIGVSRDLVATSIICPAPLKGLQVQVPSVKGYEDSSPSTAKEEPTKSSLDASKTNLASLKPHQLPAKLKPEKAAILKVEHYESDKYRTQKASTAQKRKRGSGRASSSTSHHGEVHGSNLSHPKVSDKLDRRDPSASHCETPTMHHGNNTKNLDMGKLGTYHSTSAVATDHNINPEQPKAKRQRMYISGAENSGGGTSRHSSSRSPLKARELSKTVENKKDRSSGLVKTSRGMHDLQETGEAKKGFASKDHIANANRQNGPKLASLTKKRPVSYHIPENTDSQGEPVKSRIAPSQTWTDHAYPRLNGVHKHRISTGDSSRRPGTQTRGSSEIAQARELDGDAVNMRHGDNYQMVSPASNVPENDSNYRAFVRRRLDLVDNHLQRISDELEKALFNYDSKEKKAFADNVALGTDSLKEISGSLSSLHQKVNGLTDQMNINRELLKSCLEGNKSAKQDMATVITFLRELVSAGREQTGNSKPHAPAIVHEPNATTHRPMNPSGGIIPVASEYGNVPRYAPGTPFRPVQSMVGFQQHLVPASSIIPIPRQNIGPPHHDGKASNGKHGHRRGDSLLRAVDYVARGNHHDGFSFQVLELVARQLTVWLLETPHEHHKSGMPLERWAKHMSSTAFSEVAPRLEMFSSYSHANSTLSISLNNNSVELTWFIQPLQPNCTDQARKNYEAWDPPPSDEEWRSETYLLKELAQGFHRVLETHPHREQTVLDSCVFLTRHASKRYEDAGYAPILPRLQA